MERIPEPQIMNASEQVKAYSEADFSLSDGNMVDHFEEFLKSINFIIYKENLIIDLGCGPGNITERLSLRWPSAHVIGVDGSLEMLKVARNRKEKLWSQGHSGSISYKNEELSSLSIHLLGLSKPAEVVVSNSVLHHIHEPSQFWQTVRNLGKKGSVTFHRDLRRPLSLEQTIAIKEKYQNDAPAVLNKDFLASLRAAFTVEEVKLQLKEAGLSQLKVFEVDDRYLEVVGVL